MSVMVIHRYNLLFSFSYNVVLDDVFVMSCFTLKSFKKITISFALAHIIQTTFTSLSYILRHSHRC
jgi:hypothetical protein